ncbi:flagellar basal body rod modification protein [Helicobacter saguini]|uniref:Basal-body rod modification protein FlgD n=1 Tax=Helicobacter saguini TaxID=1548018 RepID=A0A4U8T669_9HELI|nr:flagellar basal body rod modification protein [Helicobacter saguini]TLD94994.1 flagellar basal body rod modification protein [Helicobacter saguini]
MAIDLGDVTGSTAAREKKKESTQIANGLDKDAFMKLFLEQLKNQDPTSPMETDKIITQTAQLTQVEMQEENKKTMKEVAAAMKASQDTNKALQDFQKEMKKSLEILNMGMEENTHATSQGAKANSLNAVSMIGKIAETDIMGLNVNGSGENHFSLYFDNKINASQGSPIVEILNPNREVVKTISLADKDGQQGYIEFRWDGKDTKGNIVEPGSYQVRAFYNLNPETRQYDETRIGRGEVQSIIYDKGVPLMRLGDNIVPVQSALEFYPRGELASKSVESIKADASKASAYEDDLKTQNLSEKYEKIISDREERLAAEAEANKDEETLQREALEREKEQKAKEMKKYAKMLDSAEKGKQLDKGELDKLDKLAGGLNAKSADSKSANLNSLLQGSNALQGSSGANNPFTQGFSEANGLDSNALGNSNAFGNNALGNADSNPFGNNNIESTSVSNPFANADSSVNSTFGNLNPNLANNANRSSDSILANPFGDASNPFDGHIQSSNPPTLDIMG